ncbi:MAG: hypothetical protein ABSG67_10980 [Thermoguttaceae bacterium]
MRNGKNTPFDEVEKRGKELLAEYTTPEEQAQIYYELTEMHGQTGMVHADLVVQYAQKALALPVDAFQRFRLYVFWGDAIFIGNIHKPTQQQTPFYEIRKVAVRPYLEGLKEMQAYKIPEQRPNFPGVDSYDIVAPENSPVYQRFKKQHDDQMAARKKAEFDEKLWSSHQTLMNAVVDLYSKKPYAATELRQIATKTLADPAEVDALMKRIEANGALKDDPIPEKANPQTPNK